MSLSCTQWRLELERCLAGPGGFDALRSLALDAHPVRCAACRELLEEEQALELLLDELPEPAWPPARVRALLQRLRAERAGDPLDRLLERDGAPPPVPAGLAGRVLAGLADERRTGREERALDGLLDRLPAPAIPAGLEARVLAAVAAERRAPATRLVSGLPLALAAAAVVVFGLALGFLSRAGDAAAPRSTESAAALAAEAPDQELLEVLAVLENWDLLVEDELDVILSSVGPVDELLLEVDPVDLSATGAEPSRG